MKKKLIMMLFAVLVLTTVSTQLLATNVVDNKRLSTTSEITEERTPSFQEEDVAQPKAEVLDLGEVEVSNSMGIQTKKIMNAPIGLSLSSMLDFDVSMNHTRTGVTEYYNGERIRLSFTVSGATIVANEQYQITGFFDDQPLGSLSTWAFLINMDEASIPIVSSGLQIGSAQYDATNKCIYIIFTQTMTSTDISSFTIQGNLAMKEDSASASQTMAFALGDGTTTISDTVTIPTTNNGFEVVPTFSRTTNVLQYSSVNVELAWTAKSGIGKDDYFLIELPFLNDPGLGMGITFQEANGKTVEIKDENGVYGNAVYNYTGTNKYSTSTIAFNFDQNGSNQLNISGKVTLEGQYYLWTDETITVLPESKTYIVYINGEAYDVEIGIGTPNFESKKNALYKSARVGSDISNDPNASMKGFYRFGWTVTINRDKLPIFSPPNGEVLHNAAVQDFAVGPGHYIDRSAITISCLKDFTLLGMPLYETAYEWTSGLHPDNGSTSLALDQFIQYYGSGSVEIEPYIENGNTDPNKIKGFKIKFGDLDGVAMEVIYNSYIEDGSTAEIPSVKDYFFQSMMNDKKVSDKYFNKAILFSDDITKSEVTSEMSTTNMTSMMKSGNMNLRIKKVDEQGNPQVGVKFKLYWLGGNSPEVTTDANGYVEFTSMGADFYKLVETSPKADYEAIEEVLFQIPPQVDQGYLNNYMSLSDPVFKSSGGITDLDTIEESNVFVNEVVNYPKNAQCNIKILKISAETKTLLSGAGFTLFDESKNQIGTEIITGAEGIAEFSVASGVYYIQETTAPLGYFIDSNFYRIEVENRDAEIIITMQNSTTSSEIEEPTMEKKVKDSRTLQATVHTKDDSNTHGQLLAMLLSSAFLLYFYTMKKAH